MTPRIRALGNARKATVRRPAGNPRAITPPGGPRRGHRSAAAGSAAIGAGQPGAPGRPSRCSSVAGRTAPAPKRRAARSAASSASRRPCSRAPELELLRRRVGVDQALGPHPHQPDPGPVQPERVEERPRGVVELLPDVGGDVEGAAAGDRGEVGEADLDADGAGQPCARPAAGPPSARPAAAVPGGSPPGRRCRCRRSPRGRWTSPALRAPPGAGRGPRTARADARRRPRPARAAGSASARARARRRCAGRGGAGSPPSSGPRPRARRPAAGAGSP